MVKIHKMIGAKNPEQDAKDVSALEQVISKVRSQKVAGPSLATLGNFLTLGHCCITFHF